MTWTRLDDGASHGPKAVAAGNEAWGLWAAAIIYCNNHLTDGYVSLAALASGCLPNPIPLAKAKALAEKLCSVRARPDGLGLFEHAGEGLYRVHDFHDWNPSKAEVESKRKADRDRKRNRGGGGEEPGGIPRGIPIGVQPPSSADSSPPRAGARPRPAQPVPPSPAIPDQHQGPASGGAGGLDDSDDQSVPCPQGLASRLVQLGVHADLARSLKCDPVSVAACLEDFETYWVIGQGTGRRRTRWAAKARQWVIDQHKQGKLAAPGAIEHLANTAEERQQRRAGDAAMRLMREAEEIASTRQPAKTSAVGALVTDLSKALGGS